MDGMRAATMETGDRKLGPASCRIRQCTALPVHMRAKSREVTALRTEAEERGKGYGTSLMHKVCREADSAGIVLIIWPLEFDDGPLQGRALVDWYARNFGFGVIQEGPEVLMTRMPGATPKALALKPISAAALTLRTGTE